jgi:3-phytase
MPLIRPRRVLILGLLIVLSAALWVLAPSVMLWTPASALGVAPTVLPTPEPQHAPAAVSAVAVAPVVETTPVPNTGDAADDPAIWIHPINPALSTILATDKQGGLVVYDLAGNELQYLADGKMNNIDLRYNFLLGGRPVALVTASNRAGNSIAIYKVNLITRRLEPVGVQPLAGPEVYGSCMYHSSTSGMYYVFVNNKSGLVEQWKLSEGGNGQVAAQMVRTFDVGSQVEGCVADDELGHFYIGEEEIGIWKYGAEPEDGTTGTLIHSTSGEHLVSNVEGLTIYYADNGTGYLIVSSQGNNTFVIYRREGQNAYVQTFEIAAGNGIDEVSATDGVDVTNFGLGGAFPQGLFIAQDGNNDNENQNFKLVPWSVIAQTTNPPLAIDLGWDPRAVGDTGLPAYRGYLPLVAASAR